MSDETFTEKTIEGEDVKGEETDSLYAEELPDQTDLAVAAGCASSISSGSSASCPSSAATISTVGCLGVAAA